MEMWAFFDNHWFIALCALGSVYGVIVRLIRFPVLMMRGYPTNPHMDADGDIKYPEQPTNNTGGKE